LAILFVAVNNFKTSQQSLHTLDTV